MGTTRSEFAGPTAQGVLDPPSYAVFACFCIIFFDNMAPPWGVGWRKCDTRGSPEAHSQFRRCFQRPLENHQKKHCFLDALLTPFWLHLASKLAPFWDHVSLQFLGIFPMRFFWKIAAFPLPQILNFGALAYAPCDFSSFHQIANKSKTNAKSLQNGSKNQRKNLLKSRQKSMKNHIRFFIDLYLQNGTQMSPKWEGKK